MADNKEKLPSKEKKKTVHKSKNLELTPKISTWSITDPIGDYSLCEGVCQQYVKYVGGRTVYLQLVSSENYLRLSY